MSAPSPAFERARFGNANTVFKSGPLFISSKGLGWKSWKKRWFILTRTSLIFFKSDPSAFPQRGGEVNLTLGGINLNSSGSVVVREDKKLLTVLFPDGRAFTLKAESLEDLFEWKTALEHALAQAPSAALVIGHNGIFHDTNETIEGSFHQWRDKRPVKSLVVGRPILLALEDVDGGPSFLEKALQYLETFGTKVEGILRQSADVEEVDRRVQEYEHGRIEFGLEDDAHVIGDCVKHVLRELPSSPVPASCCSALLEAYKIDEKEARVNAMHAAIWETFPEPNRRLLQRLLKMMHTISSHASENRMNPSAVAACMAPLLLRPLLAGECELDDDFNMNGDNSAQLLAAANAANCAQCIIATLLEEYENIFYDEKLHRCSISAGSGIENSGTEDSTDKENLDLKNNGYHDAENEVDVETDDETERAFSGKFSEDRGIAGSDLYEHKGFSGGDFDILSLKDDHTSEVNPIIVDSHLAKYTNVQSRQHKVKQKKGIDNTINQTDSPSISPSGMISMGEILSSMDIGPALPITGSQTSNIYPIGKPTGSNLNAKGSTFRERNSAMRTPSTKSINYSGEEELTILRLEIAKNDLQNRIAKEARGNAMLQATLERRKQALHERRLALEQDVSRLQEQLQAERDLRAALEVGLTMYAGQFSSPGGMDSKTKAEIEEIALAEADVARWKQKVAELHHQLNQQRQNHCGAFAESCGRFQNIQNNNSPQKHLQQDFDTTLAFCNQERKQRTEESLLGEDWRNMQREVLAAGSTSKQPSREQFIDLTGLSNSKSTEASTSISLDDICAADCATVPSSSRAAEVMDYTLHPSTASSALVELTTRLDFFKERRSQLMEQLHSIDSNYGTVTSQNFVYRPSSPSLN